MNCNLKRKCLIFIEENQICQFGGLVSTSNTYANELLTIETNAILYWSMGLNKEN